MSISVETNHWREAYSGVAEHARSILPSHSGLQQVSADSFNNPEQEGLQVTSSVMSSNSSADGRQIVPENHNPTVTITTDSIDLTSCCCHQSRSRRAGVEQRPTVHGSANFSDNVPNLDRNQAGPRCHHRPGTDLSRNRSRYQRTEQNRSGFTTASRSSSRRNNISGMQSVQTNREPQPFFVGPGIEATDSNTAPPELLVFPLQSLPQFFHFLNNKFYFESYLWLYENVMYHPRSRLTRLRLRLISQAWNVTQHDAALATLSVHMMKYANQRQELFSTVQRMLHEVARGSMDDSLLRGLRSYAVDLCIHQNPRQMLRDYSRLIRDIKMAIYGYPDSVSPATRRRMRERQSSRQTTDSPQEQQQAFQNMNIPPRQIHPAAVFNGPHQHQQHPLLVDIDQANRMVPQGTPVSVAPYGIPVCSAAPHHVPVCSPPHIPGCNSQPTWSFPACGMQIPACGYSHLPTCGLTQLPIAHSLPPIYHPPHLAHHPTHPQPHHHHHHHHPMTASASVLHHPSPMQHHHHHPQDDDVQIIAEHRAPYHLPHHTLPPFTRPSPVILQDPSIHHQPPQHDLYAPYSRYGRRMVNRSRWRSIPPPPPPYPGFLLHFLAMLGNPPVPGPYGMDIPEEGRDVENYEALLNLAERLGDAKPKGLTKADIERLPSYRFNNESAENSKDQTCCVICICDFEHRQLLRVLPCSHEFHARCVDKWLKTNRTCPICRADASEPASQSE